MNQIEELRDAGEDGDAPLLECAQELGRVHRLEEYDARAARVMAPTTDALHDFIGRALTGLPLLGDV